ncbi:Hypothetical predicted protein [Marmota monax]|uniref:Uncharacterized protein n=1 Tax=Marmota monax TaxID=9995 RepID=A0A5E4CGV2_MARMO|nr:hypothetical protein GHT09_018258 [Marmota monax]VTJ81134.1 Hypothetical predicted protein [Marmota monax]
MIEPGPHACLSGQTPLLLTIKKNRQMMVEFFIKNKANIHAVDDNGRSIKKSHSGDSLFAMFGGSYEAHIKNIPEKGGEFIEASRQSMKDEVKYDTGNQKSGNVPDNSKPASRKKEVLETTLVQAIKIKNDCPSIPSPDSKVMC